MWQMLLGTNSLWANILTWVILNTEQEYISHSCDIQQQDV